MYTPLYNIHVVLIESMVKINKQILLPMKFINMYVIDCWLIAKGRTIKGVQKTIFINVKLYSSRDSAKASLIIEVYHHRSIDVP